MQIFFMISHNILHIIIGFISSKYFLFHFLIYCLVFYNVLHYVYHSLSLKYFVLFFLKYFTMFFNIFSNVQHKSTHAGQSLSHSFLRAHFKTAIALRHLAALLAMPAMTNSSARSQRTATARCGRVCRVAVADASFPSQYLTTALVQ